MAEVFVDTSGWAHYLAPGEPFHDKAKVAIDGNLSAGAGIVTTNYVVAELAALLYSPLGFSHARRVEAVEGIRSANSVKVVHVDPDLDEKAWDLYKRRSDKSWSLVDCASFTLMESRGITEAITTDRHFEQAEFHTLLGMNPGR